LQRGKLILVVRSETGGSSSLSATSVVNETSLRVTKMEIGDLPGVCEIEARAYQFPWKHAVFADCLGAGYSCHLIWDKKQLLGYSLVAVAAGEAHLLNLCIDPDRQGCGYAGWFLKVILRTTAELDALTVYLEVRPSNRAALALYRTFGFEQIGLRKNYYRAESRCEDAIVLSKNIASLKQWRHQLLAPESRPKCLDQVLVSPD